MDKSSLAALIVGGLAFTAGLLRLVERFVHIAWHGSEQPSVAYRISKDTPRQVSH
jgi:hypothetical protein